MPRTHISDNSGHFGPEAAALSGDACAFPGAGDVLTGKSARNDINTASPRSPVKCPNIVPYRERREATVILPRGEDGAGVWVELDGAHAAPAEEFAAEYASASAREKCQLIHCAPREC